MDQRVFLTGASQGIGRALGAELVRRGARVAFAARNVAALASLQREIDPGATKTLVLPLDVGDAAAIAPALRRAADAFGGLDVVVANAGIGIPAPAAEITLDQIRRVYEVNVFGALATLLHAVPILEKSASRILVGISSMAAWRSGPGAASYNSSKAALSSFLEGLRSEFVDRGYTVLEVNPGFVRTPMTDRNGFKMPFLVEPERAARKIADAIEKRKQHLAFPWQAHLVMALVRRLPDGLYDRIARRVARRLAAEEILGVEKERGR